MEKQIFATGSITDSAPYRSDRADKGDLEGVGTLRWVGDKLYRWVQNTHNAALSAGDSVYHAMADGDDMFKYVEDGLAETAGVLGGVVASTSIAAASSDGGSDGGFGWIQVLGYNGEVLVTNTTNVTIAAGDYLQGVSGQTYLTRDGANQPKYTRNIKILETFAVSTQPAAAKKKCLINCI